MINNEDPIPLAHLNPGDEGRSRKPGISFSAFWEVVNELPWKIRTRDSRNMEVLVELPDGSTHPVRGLKAKNGKVYVTVARVVQDEEDTPL